MKKINLYIWFSLVLFLPFGCSQKDEWKGKIDYIDGVQVVTNYDKGIWEVNKKGKKIVFTEEVAIGTLEGDENQLFHQPTYVMADQNENIYVLDSGNYRIQKFDKNGNYLLTIGRKGQGPGEILRSFEIKLDSHNDILIFDIDNNRISKFDTRGNFIDSFSVRFTPYHGVLDSEDNIYIYSRYKGKLIHKFTPQGQHLLSFMDEIKSEIKRIEPHINGSGSIGITQDNEIYLVLTSPYAIYLYDSQGKLLKKIITKAQHAIAPYITPPSSPLPDAVINSFFITGVDISPQGDIFCRCVAYETPEELDSVEKIRELGTLLFREYTYIDLFDKKGRFLIHQKTPNFSWGGYFDNKGYYYGIEEKEDYFRAVKYSIRIK